MGKRTARRDDDYPFYEEFGVTEGDVNTATHAYLVDCKKNGYSTPTKSSMAVALKAMMEKRRERAGLWKRLESLTRTALDRLRADPSIVTPSIMAPSFIVSTSDFPATVVPTNPDESSDGPPAGRRRNWEEAG